MARPAPRVHEVLRDDLEPIDPGPVVQHKAEVLLTKTDPEAEVWIVKPRHCFYARRLDESFALTACPARRRQGRAQVVRLRRVCRLTQQLSRVSPHGLTLVVFIDEALKSRNRNAAVALSFTLVRAGLPVNRRLLALADQSAASALPFAHVRAGARVVEARRAIARARRIEALTGVESLRARRVDERTAVNPFEHLRGGHVILPGLKHAVAEARHRRDAHAALIAEGPVQARQERRVALVQSVHEVVVVWIPDGLHVCELTRRGQVNQGVETFPVADLIERDFDCVRRVSRRFILYWYVLRPSCSFALIFYCRHGCDGTH